MRCELILTFVATTLTALLLFFSFYHHQQEKAPLQANCNPFSPKVSKEDGERIKTLIPTIAHSSYPSLLFKQRDLRKIGDILDQNISPFVFLAYIFSDLKLTQDMKRIQKSSVKYNNFLQGLQKNLVKVYNEGCLYQIAKGFSAYLRRDADTINQLLKQGIENGEGRKDSKAFAPFLDYLIKTS